MLKLRFHPDADAGGAGASDSQDGSADSKAETPGESGKTVAGEPPKNESEKLLKALNSERALREKTEKEFKAFKRATEERERHGKTADERVAEAEKRAADAEGETARLAARITLGETLDKKIEALGDGFTVPRGRVMELATGLTGNGEDVESVIDGLLNDYKRPKAIKPKDSGGTPPKEESKRKEPKDLTGRELAELEKSDPKEFRRVIEARRAALTPPARVAIEAPPMRK